MPTRITEVTTPDTKRTTLRVEGTLRLEDAKLIEQICLDMKQRYGKSVTLDLADLCFLDSDSAHLLCRLRAEQHISFEGLHLFVQRVIEMAERDDKSEDSDSFENPCGR
ncbi:MAG: hypothetical protein ACRD9R_01555 [Pyrinomonadaceae bacterium]